MVILTEAPTHMERLVERNLQLRAFLLRLTDPDDLGHAVSAEVRAQAMSVLRVGVPSGTVKA